MDNQEKLPETRDKTQDVSPLPVEPIGLDYEVPPRKRRRWVAILLVGIFVSILLLAVVPIRLRSSRGNRGLSAAMTDIAALSLALDAFEIDTGSFPTTAQGLAGLVAPPAGVLNWHGPYISKTGAPTDPWGRPYLYTFPGIRNKTGFDLSSAGPDGKPGTADDLRNR